MYELLYIVPAKFTEEELAPMIEKINELIKNQGGEIISTENLGKKKLAYQIKQIFRGYYIFNRFNLNPQNLKELNKNLQLDSNILRFLITKFEIEKKPKKEIKPKIKKEKISSEELDKKLEEILKV